MNRLKKYQLTPSKKWFKAISPRLENTFYSNNPEVFAKEHNMNLKMINLCLNNKIKSYKKWWFIYI
jgi:hypothetical protein